MIENYSDFVEALMARGFSLGGGAKAGDVMNVARAFGPGIEWHTGDAETDPWAWRMRVLAEREDVAYGKVFLRKSGYITREWYAAFVCVRGTGSLFDAYYAGEVSAEAKRIYEVVAENGDVPLDLLKEECGFGKEKKAAFDRGLVELQMRLWVTISGQAQKVNQEGKPYGWPATVFSTSEAFFGREVWEEAKAMRWEEAYGRIEGQIRRYAGEEGFAALGERAVRKFIVG